MYQKPIDYDEKIDLMTFNKEVFMEEIERIANSLQIPRTVIDEWKTNSNSPSNTRYDSNYFPFYLEKFDQDQLTYEVIYYYPKTEKLVYEYRKYGFPNGKFYAIKAKRRFVLNKEIPTFLTSGFIWVSRLKIGLSRDYKKMEQGIFEENYEDLL